MIEAGPRRSIDTHVPFANEGSFVAGVVQQAWPGDHGVALRAAIDVVVNAIGVDILTRHKAGSAGRAERRGGESVLEDGPLFGQAVDVGRLHERMTGAAELVEPQIIHEDEDDVGSWRLSRGATNDRAGTKCTDDQEDKTAGNTHGDILLAML